MIDPYNLPISTLHVFTDPDSDKPREFIHAKHTMALQDIERKRLCGLSALNTAVSALADLVPKVFTFASVA
jgi:hypothetical protein